MLRSMSTLGTALWNQGRYGEAEQEFRQLLDADRRVLGSDHPETLKAMSVLALAIQSQGRLAEAEQRYREVLAAQQRVLGPDHPSTVGTISTLRASSLSKAAWPMPKNWAVRPWRFSCEFLFFNHWHYNRWWLLFRQHLALREWNLPQGRNLPDSNLPESHGWYSFI